jgi:hypothetical protein
MTAELLFVQLQQHGIRLEISGGDLRYRAPRDGMALEMLKAIKEHKEGLISLLKSDRTLPSEIIIPANLANNDESIRACIDAQRVGRAVA